MFLKGGVMIDHEVEATEIGSPQGGVVAPRLLEDLYNMSRYGPVRTVL